MNVEDIEKLSLSQFEEELTQENYDFAIETYKELWNALETYQEGARLSHEDNYLSINEYFDLVKEQHEIKREYLKDQFEAHEESLKERE